ncbi:Uncharacterised protein [Mycobacteroides abscessus subsp. abscessus]|nr:Uncharacterised protein [Mycobacteroides abscessus subsp. abscessus]SII17894.1 Uncharacterised protein [Mycobacteroides abscessus subsp. bolletii]SHW49389.1 Uncharacterised protein [Mycobacteroides abscessus subsp. abscessus]SIH60250.1 Uncharacterised protein [Mycobacteroides abscessus subsp. abscessus]SKD15757.1 Uncharacterised protein [Mycobacteroides abscessus subsp. abscessus]
MNKLLLTQANKSALLSCLCPEIESHTTNMVWETFWRLRVRGSLPLR